MNQFKHEDNDDDGLTKWYGLPSTSKIKIATVVIFISIIFAILLVNVK